MAGLLIETVRNWGKTPFIWGDSDCAVSVLRYVEKATGRRLKVQPTHSSEMTAKLLSFLNGGFKKYVGKVAVELGCTPTDEPRKGDIGIVAIPGMGLTLCINLGQMWVAKGDYKTLIADGSPVLAWRVYSCHQL